MWSIGQLTEEYRRRMHELLSLYARRYDPTEPVICRDEKRKTLPRKTRCPLPATPGVPLRQDYEYERAGTRNICVAVEPRGRNRHVQVTERPTKEDFVGFVCRMLRRGYSEVRKVHLVLDNLNTHLRASVAEVLGKEAAASILRRIQFHYTPVHASWLNMGPRSRSASSSDSVWRAVPPSRPPSPARSPLGRDAETPLNAASSGHSRVGTWIESCLDIIFRN